VFWATEALIGLIRDVRGTIEIQTDGGGTVLGAEQVVIPEGGTF
jgi:hypothetical protein